MDLLLIFALITFHLLFPFTSALALDSADNNNTLVWLTNPGRATQNQVLQFLDPENDENPENHLRQSLEDHSESDDTLSRRMRLEINVRKDQNNPYVDVYCDTHKACGANGNCDLTLGIPCVCLNGYTPKSPSDWEALDYSQGCVRKIPLNCSTDVFIKYGVFKVPSGTYMLLNQSLTQEDCGTRCLSNCSCVAYTMENGCKLWTGDLFDVRVRKEGGNDLHIRMAASALGMNSSSFL